MTEVRAGGVVIRGWAKTKVFYRDYGKLTPDQKDLFEKKLQDLIKVPMPPGLRFEKLEGHSNPPIYTCHMDGNYKFSLEINGDQAIFRRVGVHNDIDRAP